MTDIVKRLRDWRGDPDEIMDEAADEIERLRAANTKLVCAIDLIREALDGSEVQDLRQTINAALAEYRSVQKPSAAQQFGGDLWAGIL